MKHKAEDISVENRLKFLEENRRFIQNSLESALRLGDFQEKITTNSTAEQVFEETEKRINSLIQFEARAFCLVDPDDSDLVMTFCEPESLQLFLKDEIEFMIEKRFIAWAIRERRGVTILSKNQKRQFILHVISTDSKIRGMFIGLFPEPIPRVPDASLQILSIIFRNVANTLESIEYYDLIRNQKQLLQIEVEQKTREMLSYERQLQQAQKSEAIATLAGGIAHEFNNALSAVVGFFELLKLDFSENEKGLNDIEYIHPSIQRMINLTDQLLAYARGGKYHLQKIAMNDFVQNTLPTIQHALNPSICIETDLLADTWIIEADLIQMQMVLAAILTNASEAIDGEGHISISTRNVVVDDHSSKEFADLSSNRSVALVIEDNGRGMDETTRRRLFDPFYTTKVHGRGLGMAAVYGIIKNHDGWIKVDSEFGKGTRVSIYLPAGDDASMPEKKNGGCVDSGTETILLVEDEDVVVDISKEILSRLGYETLVAKTGQEAVDMSNSDEQNFDLVLLDMKLPDSDGKNIYSAIKDARPNVKVILFSGFSIDGPVQEILDSGADGFVQKPFSVSTLSVKLREALG
jgi:signal transduction histidine kinase